MPYLILRAFKFINSYMFLNTTTHVPHFSVFHYYLTIRSYLTSAFYVGIFYPYDFDGSAGNSDLFIEAPNFIMKFKYVTKRSAEG